MGKVKGGKLALYSCGCNQECEQWFTRKLRNCDLPNKQMNSHIKARDKAKKQQKKIEISYNTKLSNTSI